MKNLRPCEDFVLLEFFEGKSVEKKTQGGIVLPNTNTRTPDYAMLISVGENIDLRNKSYKIGDKIFFNEYDAKKIQDFDSDRIFILVREKNIMAAYE
jgi:co-chaperonin GroES (HSP10)